MIVSVYRKNMARNNTDLEFKDFDYKGFLFFQ